MPLAQSSELPPPSATIPSTRAAPATSRRRRTLPVGVLREVVEAGDGDAGRFEHLLYPLRVAGPHHPRIADEQHPAEAEFLRERAAALDHAGPED